MEQQLLHSANEEQEATSPFLPGTNIQFAWDSTSLGYFKTCPRLYYYQMIEGWSSRNESIHLRFGIEYHRALQEYDISRCAGINHKDAVFDITKALLERLHDYPDPGDNAKPSEDYKTRSNLLRAVIWYLDQFEHDPAQTYVKADGMPAVEVSFRFELDYGPRSSGWHEPKEGERFTYTPYLLCGHLDRIVRFPANSDDLYVMDRKTTTSTPGSYYFQQYEPNNQMTLYTVASQLILGSPIRGVIIDVAQIAVGFSRFTRGFTYRTPDQIEEWLVDLRSHLALAEHYAVDNHWPMNDTACDKWGGCRFRDVCSKSPQVRERFLESQFERKPIWNPLLSRG